MQKETKFKYLCLVALVCSNVVLVFAISLSRSVKAEDESEDTFDLTGFDIADLTSSHMRSSLYLSSTVVFCAEILKLIVSLGLEYYTTNRKNLSSFLNQTKNHILDIETIKIGLPGFLYVVENNLLFIALSNLSVNFFEVTDQLKIITTAYFSTVLLKHRLSYLQKVSLLLLACGVATVEISSNEEESFEDDLANKNQVLGFVTLILTCCISGFAGVYFEKIVKQNENVSIYIRNVQLAIWGASLGLFTALISSENLIEEYGFFQNYNFLTWTVVSSLALTGVLNALVIRYADNILKGFAASISTVVASLISAFAFGSSISNYFVLGSATVVLSIFLYGYASKRKKYYAASPSFVI